MNRYRAVFFISFFFKIEDLNSGNVVMLTDNLDYAAVESTFIPSLKSFRTCLNQIFSKITDRYKVRNGKRSFSLPPKLLRGYPVYYAHVSVSAPACKQIHENLHGLIEKLHVSVCCEADAAQAVLNFAAVNSCSMPDRGGFPCLKPT